MNVLFPVAAQAEKDDSSVEAGFWEVDWDTKERVWNYHPYAEEDLPELAQSGKAVLHKGFRPSGVDRLPDGRTICAGWRDVRFASEDGEPMNSLSHPEFNDVHEVRYTDKGTVLICSTGMDSIFEVDPGSCEIVWSWRLWKYVGDFTPPENDYYPPKLVGKEAHKYALDPYRRAHVNYAEHIGEDLLLCSALNYGVFTVNKKTKHIKRKWTDFGEVHGPYPLNEGYLVAESGKNRIVEIDKYGKELWFYSGDLSYPKRAVPIGDNLIIADCKNARIVEVNREKEVVSEMDLPEGSAPYTVRVIE